jgi:PAS domain S-box-containing protein
VCESRSAIPAVIGDSPPLVRRSVMTEPTQTDQKLPDASAALGNRLARAEATLDVVCRGGVEALAVAGAAGEAMFTLCGAGYLRRLVMETMRVGVLVVRVDGVILHANCRAGAMLETPRELVTGTALRTWVLAGDLERLTALVEEARTGGPACGEIGLRRRSGGSLHVQVSVDRFHAEDIEGATLVLDDLSAERLVKTALDAGEAQVQAALAREQEMHGQLARNERLAGMGRVIAAVAHELNNPLQTIRNYLYLAANEFAPGAAGQMYLETAASEIRRITSLVAQLREVYRVPASQAMLPVDLLAVLGEVRELLAHELRTQQVEWRLASQLVEAWADGCADELKQVFLNLVQNAIEAMRPTGGTLYVEVNPAPATDRIGVTFRDTGPGLAQESMAQLFEPFFSTKRFGLGLGLCICMGIIKRHHGEIDVASPPGQGAAFTVWLPAASADR